MYEALGFTGKTKLLVAGIYNCAGPIASKSSKNTYSLNPILMK